MIRFVKKDTPAVRTEKSYGFFRRLPLAILLILMLGWCFCGQQEAPEPEPDAEATKEPGCAVLFFQNQEPNPKTDWIGRGIAELLTFKLAQDDQLKVTRPAQLEAILRIMDQTDTSRLTDQILMKVAERIPADRVVLGNYHIAGDRFVINARLVDVSDGAVLAERQAQGTGPPDLFQMAAEIAAAMEDGLGVETDPGFAGIQPTEDIAAFQAFIRGLEAFRRFDIPEGMAHLVAAINTDPGFAMAHAAQAIQAYSIGDLPRAIGAISHTSRHPERLAETQRLMIKAIEENTFGNYDKSFETFRRFREKFSPDPEIYLVLAQMFYTVRDHASAETIYQDLLRQDPQNVNAHIMLGLNQLELGLPDLARSEVEEALRLKADHPYAHIAMSRISAYQGNPEEAEHHLRQASRLNPEDPWIHNQLGYFYLTQNKTDLALREFQRYVELAPDDPNAHDSLAEGYLRIGRADLAEKEYLRALELKPDFDHPHFMLARIYEDQGEKQKASRMFQKYLQISPRGPRAKEAEARLGALGE